MLSHWESEDEGFNFAKSLTVKGGILTVADDLLKNEGKKFLDMMEKLAERRVKRDERDSYDESETDEDYDDEYDEEETEELTGGYICVVLIICRGTKIGRGSQDVSNICSKNV